MTISLRFGTVWRWCLGALGVAATALLVVGVVDVVSASKIIGRVTGVALTVLAVLTLAAIHLAWARDPTKWLPGAVAAGAMLAVALATASATFPPHQSHVVAAVAVAAAVGLVAATTLVLAWILWRRQTASVSGRPVVRNKEMIGSAATIGAALVAVPIAWYTGYYVPNQTFPTVTIESEIGEITALGNRASATITIKATNTSDTSVRIIGSMYVLAGTTIATNDTPDPPLDPTKVTDLTGSEDYDYGPAARYNAITIELAPKLIQFGQVVRDQVTLIPNESTQTTVAALFPVGEFDLLRLGVDFAIAREDRLTTGESIKAPASAELTGHATNCDGRDVMIRTWPIQPSNLVERLTHERTEVVLGKVMYDPYSDHLWWPSQPYLAYRVQQTGNGCDNLLNTDVDYRERATKDDLAGAVTERLVPIELSDNN